VKVKLALKDGKPGSARCTNIAMRSRQLSLRIKNAQDAATSWRITRLQLKGGPAGRAAIQISSKTRKRLKVRRL
jgi:hypothetical protein